MSRNNANETSVLAQDPFPQAGYITPDNNALAAGFAHIAIPCGACASMYEQEYQMIILLRMIGVLWALGIMAMPLATAAEPPGTMAAQSHAVMDSVNINTASAEQMAKVLRGIGLRKALAIVRYREENGPFSRPDDITKVKGIGGFTFRRNRDRIIIMDEQ